MIRFCIIASLFVAALGHGIAFSRVVAAECITIAADKAEAESKGIEWLGVRPTGFVSGGQLVYYRRGGVTFISPVVGGCVSRQAYPVGPYVAEVGV